MTQEATVERVLPDGRAEVSVLRRSACAHDCADCAGCGAVGNTVTVVCDDPIGVQVGQKVLIESKSAEVERIAFLVYALPVILFLLGVFCLPARFGEAARLAVSGALFAFGIAAAIGYDRQLRRRGGISFTISRLL